MKMRSGHHLKQCVSLSFFTHCNGSSCCSSACFCQVRPQDLLVSLALVSRFVPPAHPRQVGPAHVLVAGLFRVLVTRLVEPEVVAVLVVVFLHLVRLVFVLFSQPLQELLSLYELPWSCGCTIACGPSRPFSRNRWESSREVHQRSLDEVFALGHVEFGELSKLADEFSISVFDTLSLKLASRAAHCWGDFRSKMVNFSCGYTLQSPQVHVVELHAMRRYPTVRVFWGEDDDGLVLRSRGHTIFTMRELTWQRRSDGRGTNARW